MTPADVLRETGEAVQLFAAPTDDFARDEEDNTVVSPELVLQLLQGQHHSREEPALGSASEIFTINRY